MEIEEQNKTQISADEIKIDFSLILISSLIFLISFLWKDFLTDVEDMYFPKFEGLHKRFLFILIITFIVIGLIVVAQRYIGIDGNEVRRHIMVRD